MRILYTYVHNTDLDAKQVFAFELVCCGDLTSCYQQGLLLRRLLRRLDQQGVM